MRASRISVPHRSNGAPGGHGARFGLSPSGWILTLTGKPLSRRSGTTDIHPGDVRLLTSAHRSVQDRV
jgi:hypothetical protein